jgi:hypothetical protein
MIDVRAAQWSEKVQEARSAAESSSSSAPDDPTTTAQSDDTARKGAQRGKLGQYIELADIRLHIIAQVATGQRPEHPELKPPEPTGNETIDRHRALLHKLRVEAAQHEGPYWKASAIAWAAEVRKWLRENLEESYAYRFDYPVREKPRMGAPFQQPPDMRELWEELAVRQERLLTFMGEIK